VYCYAYGGKMPEQISQKNADLTDDRPDNLRPVTTSQRRMSSQGKLGRDLPKGVSEQNKQCNRPFYARIKSDGKQRYLGSFETVEEAEAAYDAAAKNLFGEYARPNNYQAGRQKSLRSQEISKTLTLRRRRRLASSPSLIHRVEQNPTSQTRWG